VALGLNSIAFDQSFSPWSEYKIVILTLLTPLAKNDQSFKNCLQVAHYAILSSNIAFNRFVNLFSFNKNRFF